MVNVEVDDEHPLEVVPGLEIFCGYRDIVNQAETHPGCRPGMVSGRPDKAEDGTCATLHEGVGSIEQGAGRVKGCLKGAR